MARKEHSWRRRAATAVALLATALTVVGADAPPAGAARSTVSVSPSTGVRDGDTVAVTVSGADFTQHSIVQCDAAYLTDPLIELRYPSSVGASFHCIGSGVSFTAEPGTTTTVDVVVRESFTIGETVTCGDAPADCILVDLDRAAIVPAEAGGYAPISVEPTPALTVSPMPAESSPWTVTVAGSRFRPEAVTVAQCSATWAESPDPATADASCGAPLTVTPDAAGGFSASMSLTDPVSTRDGGSVPCGLEGCRLVAGYAGEPVRASAVVSFAVPTFTASPTTSLQADTTTRVTISGVRGETARVSLCTDIPAGTHLPEGQLCFPPYDQTVPLTDGAGAIDFPVEDGRYDYFPPQGGPGTTLDCGAISCYLAAFTSSGEQIDEPIPVTYMHITLGTSADGWDEGTVAQVRLEHLPETLPRWEIDVCNQAATSCEPSVIVSASADGRAETPVTLTQAPGDTAICRLTCIVRARPVTQSGPTLTAEYHAPDPSAAVAPASGLTDGQSVVVTGTGMMQPYEGRPLFLPTGGWAVALCHDSANATLADILLKCTVPAGGSPVTVTDHRSVNTVTVPARFTASLGGATFDCTAYAGACRLALVRWDQDGALTTTGFELLTFATG